MLEFRAQCLSTGPKNVRSTYARMGSLAENYSASESIFCGHGSIYILYDAENSSHEEAIAYMEILGGRDSENIEQSGHSGSENRPPSLGPFITSLAVVG